MLIGYTKDLYLSGSLYIINTNFSLETFLTIFFELSVQAIQQRPKIFAKLDSLKIFMQVAETLSINHWKSQF